MSKAPGLAGGGIIAFKEPTEENNQSLVTDEKPVAPPLTAGQILQQRVMQGKPLGDVTTQPAGIMQAAPTPPAAPPNLNQAIQGATDLTPAMKALQTDVAKEAAIPYEDRLAEVRAAKKAAGLEEPGVEQRARLMAERANAEDEANRTKNLRLAEFFASWGSTPGPTLSAGMAAFKQTVPNLISDQKEAKRIRMEIDKSIAGLDEATRLEKKGDYDAATALKTKWADRMQTVNLEVIKIQEEEAKGVRKDKRDETANIAKEKREEAKDIRYAGLQKDITQMKIDSDERLKKIDASWRSADKADASTDRLLGIWRSAQDARGTAEQRIGNIMKTDEYQRALEASTMDASSSPAAAKMQANAKAALTEFQDSFKTMRDTADKTVSILEDRLRARKIDIPDTKTKSKKDRPALDDPTLQQ
jgi:hypothetical protein